MSFGLSIIAAQPVEETMTGPGSQNLAEAFTTAIKRLQELQVRLVINIEDIQLCLNSDGWFEIERQRDHRTRSAGEFMF